MNTGGCVFPCAGGLREGVVVPFVVITGRFRVLGQTATGAVSGFEPDGDSVQFAPDQPDLLDELPTVGQPVELTAVGSTQLRMEGIDALELHYAGSHQPRPLADQGRDTLIEFLGLGPLQYRPPAGTRVAPPAPNDGRPGWIASRSLDIYGRPIAWVFPGQPPAADGAQVFLDADLVRTSANHKQLKVGMAYPLFYDTLFASLRQVMTDATVDAQTAAAGLWERDRLQVAVDASTIAALEESGVTWPKLYRRLIEFHQQQPNRDLTDFVEWLGTEKPEQVLDLDNNANFTHLDDLIEVTGNKVRLTRAPHRMVVMSAKD